MKEKPENLKQLFKEKMDEIKHTSELEGLRVEFLGKKGHVAEMMSDLRSLPNDQKKEEGQRGVPC